MATSSHTIKHMSAGAQAKDYRRGDEVRDELAAAGIMIMDTPTGTTWRPGLRAQAADEPI